MNKKYHRPEVPEPACPDARKEPLPWYKPKPFDEHSECPNKIQAILDSASYTPAVEDVEFLNSDATRSVRLQLDYLKPEGVLREHGVQHTIVVFGSTRIVEPRAMKEDMKERTGAWDGVLK